MSLSKRPAGAPSTQRSAWRSPACRPVRPSGVRKRRRSRRGQASTSRGSLHLLEPLRVSVRWHRSRTAT